MSELAIVDCVEGIQVECTSSGRGLVNGKHNEEEDESWLIPTKAVEVDCSNIKWSKSMIEAFEDKKNGRYKIVNINNFWNV